MLCLDHHNFSPRGRIVLIQRPACAPQSGEQGYVRFSGEISFYFQESHSRKIGLFDSRQEIVEVLQGLKFWKIYIDLRGHFEGGAPMYH